MKDILARLGLKQAELARLLDVSPRTVSLWATGGGPLPGPVAAYLRVLQRLDARALADELSRLSGRARMFDEGLYSIDYAAKSAGGREIGSALAVLRNGRILGSDRLGGVFTGSYEFDPASARNRMHVRVQVPPEGELVTGYAAGPRGATVDIVASFERAAPMATTEVDVAGEAMEVKLTYLGPLPS